MKILLIPFLVLCVVRISKSECPPEEEIRPCVCSQSSNPITVKCSRIINQETLVKVFTKSFDFPMQSLILQDSSIPYVPSKVPESKKLGSLSIINCSMSSVFEQPPKSPHLVSLTLANITLQRGIDWEILSGLQPQVIHIEGVHVKKIKPSFTKHLSPALKKFKLINTRTVSFSENAFAKFNNLEELVCAHGSIRTITRSMLPTTCKLSLLDLTANEIDELPDGLFSNCHKLAKVLLAYNQLRHFTAAVWQEVWDHALLEVTLEGEIPTLVKKDLCSCCYLSHLVDI
ncbi:uncharacterized protein CDAR_472511 [Caerostris darwini]|uniref:Uncharacterized protein n=1 Tax=Caerostris darwini TaxID=1538125 RepID=A0AAV4VJJ1_9ARAC|nr:uncharacterized protein CDAR_472511 [Caerostris darwini]